MKSRTAILLLRSIHGLFALYFISCIVYIWYAAITLRIDYVLGLAVLSIFIEGFLVFILNGGHCPLAPLQQKLKDPVPFFNLFLPDYLAKKAIPFFTGITFLGMLVIIFRLLL